MRPDPGPPPQHPLYLAWLAEPVADGERRPRAPLHLTLVPPFAGDEGAVLGAIRAAVSGSLPVAAAAAGTARFGPRRDVPVVLVAPHDSLRALHEALMDALRDAGVDLGHARHVRDSFTPHVSGWSALVCGPAAMVADASAALRRLGVPPSRIQAEGFG